MFICLLHMQIPCGHFGRYVQNVVKELYEPLRAAVHGTLNGPGTLGTILLCETLISYLPTCMFKDQPYRMLRAYDLVPVTALQSTKRLDLRRFAELRSGVLYVPKPAFQTVWVPFGRNLPSSARATASTMLQFLEQLGEGRNTASAIGKASTIIVTQFMHDLVEMGVARNTRAFTNIAGDGFACDIIPAEEYVARVFVPEQLPSQMSTRSFLRLALDLLDPKELKSKLAETLRKQACLVPCIIVHSRSVQFSSAAFSLLTEGNLSVWISKMDAKNMVKVATPLLSDYFSFTKKTLQTIVKLRPRLLRCVRNAIKHVRQNTRVTRHLLAVACVVVVELAHSEGLLQRPPDYSRIYRATNLYRYLRLSDLRDIISRADEGTLDVRTFHIALDRLPFRAGALRTPPPLHE